MGINRLPLELDIQTFVRRLVAVLLSALVDHERAGKLAGVCMVSFGAVLVFLLLRLGQCPQLKDTDPEAE